MLEVLIIGYRTLIVLVVLVPLWLYLRDKFRVKRQGEGWKEMEARWRRLAEEYKRKG